MKKEFIVLNCIAQSIFDKKGVNILVLDVTPCTPMTDYVILAEGLVDSHVKAIAREVLVVMEKEGISLSFEEGLKNGDWVVLDFTWVVVHLFMPGMREKYELENLWPEAEVVDVTIDVSSKIKNISLEASSC
ncbi:MAG: ribosome silencing factor [Verrucomicrobia bacterium]|nr:ribosome silencing factor [Verrucomicrobiota bacterium]